MHLDSSHCFNKYYFYCVFSRGVAHRQQLRQYDAEKAEDNLSTKKTQRDDMIAQKVIALNYVTSSSS